MSDYIFKNSIDCGLPEYYVLTKLHIADRFSSVDDSESQKYCQSAISFLENSDKSSYNSYLLNKIYQKILSFGYIDKQTKEYYEGLCDYYAIGRAETQGMDLLSELEYWSNMFWVSMHMNDSQIACYNHFFELISNNLDNPALYDREYYNDYIAVSSRRTIICAEYVYLSGKQKEAVEIMAKGMRRAICFYNGNGFCPESDNDIEVERREAITYAIDSILDIEFVLRYTDWYRHYIASRVIKYIIELGNQINPDIIAYFENPNSESMNSLYVILENAIKSTNVSDYSNELIVYNRFLYLPSNVNEQPEFHRFIDLFNKYFTNQTDEFDFKQ